MTIVKNTEKANCPFALFEECNSKCMLFRKGIRYSEKPGAEPTPFEDCAINIIADNLEAMHNRTYMMQKEVGDTKNMIALKTMIDLRMGSDKDINYLKEQLSRLSCGDVDSKLIDN